MTMKAATTTTTTTKENATNTNTNTGTLPENVILLRNEKTGADVFLVGVNHISSASVTSVREVIRKVKPDTVFLELEEGAISEFRKPWPPINPPAVKISNVASLGRTISQYSTYFISLGIGLRPGLEMKVAYDEARKLNSEIVYGERDLDVTWKRITRNITYSEVFDALKHLPSSPLYNTFRNWKTLSNDQIRNNLLSTGITSTKLDSEDHRIFLPAMKKPFQEERDLYLASGLRGCKGKVVVGVVGLAHLKGIREHLNDKEDEAEMKKKLNEIPPQTLFSATALPLASTISILIPTIFTRGVLKGALRLYGIKEVKKGLPKVCFWLTTGAFVGLEFMGITAQLLKNIYGLHYKLWNNFHKNN